MSVSLAPKGSAARSLIVSAESVVAGLAPSGPNGDPPQTDGFDSTIAVPTTVTAPNRSSTTITTNPSNFGSSNVTTTTSTRTSTSQPQEQIATSIQGSQSTAADAPGASHDALAGKELPPKKLSRGDFTGIAFAALCLFVALLVLVFMIRRHRRLKRENTAAETRKKDETTSTPVWQHGSELIGPNRTPHRGLGIDMSPAANQFAAPRQAGGQQPSVQHENDPGWIGYGNKHLHSGKTPVLDPFMDSQDQLLTSRWSTDENFVKERKKKRDYLRQPLGGLKGNWNEEQDTESPTSAKHHATGLRGLFKAQAQQRSKNRSSEDDVPQGLDKEEKVDDDADFVDAQVSHRKQSAFSPSLKEIDEEPSPQVDGGQRYMPPEFVDVPLHSPIPTQTPPPRPPRANIDLRFSSISQSSLAPPPLALLGSRPFSDAARSSMSLALPGERRESSGPLSDAARYSSNSSGILQLQTSHESSKDDRATKEKEEDERNKRPPSGGWY